MENDGLRARGLTKQALYWRLRRGWSLEDAVTRPVANQSRYARERRRQEEQRRTHGS